MRTYRSTEYGFEVTYPVRFPGSEEDKWTANNVGLAVRFGPSAYKDCCWRVIVHENTNIEGLIAEIGDQFKTRHERRKTIMVNNTPALLVTVWTDDVRGWIARTVYFGGNKYIYEISDGALYDYAFKYFYESFRLVL